MEKYYKVKKEIAIRAGLDERVRTETEDGLLLLSEKDIRNIPMLIDEKVKGLDGILYVEDDSKFEQVAE